jgi:hypothetical protein
MIRPLRLDHAIDPLAVRLLGLQGQPGLLAHHPGKRAAHRMGLPAGRRDLPRWWRPAAGSRRFQLRLGGLCRYQSGELGFPRRAVEYRGQAALSEARVPTQESLDRQDDPSMRLQAPPQLPRRLPSRWWPGAQEFAPDLDRSAEAESRPHINPRVRYNIADASLVDAQHVTRISKTQRDRRGKPMPDELHLRIGVDAIPERFEQAS